MKQYLVRSRSYWKGPAGGYAERTHGGYFLDKSKAKAYAEKLQGEVKESFFYNETKFFVEEEEIVE